MAQLGKAKPTTPDPQLPAFRSKVVPYDGPSSRATHFQVRFDGGGLTVHVYEMREATDERPTFLVEQWRFVEVARFALSPSSLKRLVDAALFAVASYKKAMGHDLPEDAKMTAALKEMAAETRAKSG
jgi:hypothetical protein